MSGTTVLSVILVKTGVTEIGRKSRRIRDFWNWTNPGLFSLTWYCGCREWEVKQMWEWSTEDWRTKSEEPRWKNVKTGCCWPEFIKIYF